jgi:hypothetical protein
MVIEDKNTVLSPDDIRSLQFGPISLDLLHVYSTLVSVSFTSANQSLKDGSSSRTTLVAPVDFMPRLATGYANVNHWSGKVSDDACCYLLV